MGNASQLSSGNDGVDGEGVNGGDVIGVLFSSGKISDCLPGRVDTAYFSSMSLSNGLSSGGVSRCGKSANSGGAERECSVWEEYDNGEDGVAGIVKHSDNDTAEALE